VMLSQVRQVQLRDAKGDVVAKAALSPA